MRVWIQRGHVARTTGSTGTAGEQDYVSRVAVDAADILKSHGHTVRIAGADERIVGAWDLFIALHCDGSVSSTASGASVGYRDSAGQAAARVWKDRFTRRGWPHGWRDDNYTSALRLYYGTGWARDAGINRAFIVEHGFLTNPTKDRAWLTSAEGRRAAALALADTVNLLAGKGPIDDIEQPEEDDVPLPKFGDESEDVRELQQGLWDWANDPDLGNWQQWLKNTRMAGRQKDGPGGWADGKFGKATADAVTYFKRQNWLKPDDATVTLFLIARLEGKRWLAPLNRKVRELEGRRSLGDGGETAEKVEG